MSTPTATVSGRTIGLAQLADLAAEVTKAKRALDIARDDRDYAIRGLLEAGARVEDIAAAVGVNPSRIYQIADATPSCARCGCARGAAIHRAEVNGHAFAVRA